MGRNGGGRKKTSRAGSKKSGDQYAQASGLVGLAERKLQEGDLIEADKAASKALAIFNKADDAERPAQVGALYTINLLASIKVELGEIEISRKLFLEAVDLDPVGALPEVAGGGAEKFLWLAQISEDGGRDSITWFQRGADVLRQNLIRLGESMVSTSGDETRAKLADTLCAMAEIYMTDLSWEADAETQCESLISEAVMVAPKQPEPLQTLASIRISQSKPEEARKALIDSMQLWQDCKPEDNRVPAFPTRISLARLLMEVDMDREAMDVIERLVMEDDQSVEAWYLGGWCLYLLAGRPNYSSESRGSTVEEDSEQRSRNAQIASREWLKQSLQLYELLAYEDERLKQHTAELLESLNDFLGPAADDQDDDVLDDDSNFGSDDSGAKP